MSDGKPYCEGWLYDYSRTDGKMVCHLFPPGSDRGSPSLCGFLVRADRVDWLTRWGEPDEENETSGDICPTCLTAYVDRRDGPTLDDLRREALAIVEEELGEVIA